MTKRPKAKFRVMWLSGGKLFCSKLCAHHSAAPYVFAKSTNVCANAGCLSREQGPRAGNAKRRKR